MNAATKTILFLVLLAAAGIGIAMLVGGDPDGAPPVQQSPPSEIDVPPEQPAQPLRVGKAQNPLPANQREMKRPQAFSPSLTGEDGSALHPATGRAKFAN